MQKRSRVFKICVNDWVTLEAKRAPDTSGHVRFFVG